MSDVRGTARSRSAPLGSRTLARVSDMLGLPAAPARADLEKLNAGALEDIVANADELRAFLRDTPYAHYL